MKVRKETLMGIDDALNALHLTNPQKKKRKRLSAITCDTSDTSISGESILSIDIINEESDPVFRRSNRKKSTPVRWNPQNCIANTTTLNANNLDDIRNYYLPQSVNIQSTSLETIQEEGNFTESLNKIIGNRKFRRYLQFDKTSKSRMRKRKENALKLKTKKKTIKATLEDLHKRLNLIDKEECYNKLE